MRHVSSVADVATSRPALDWGRLCVMERAACVMPAKRPALMAVRLCGGAASGRRRPVRRGRVTVAAQFISDRWVVQ